MVKREEIKLEKDGKLSEHIFYSSEDSTKLAVIYPGGGNNATRPFLYFLRDYFLRNGYDVLTISYKNIVDRNSAFDEKMNKMADSIYEAIQKCNTSKQYSSILFASRSIGNVIANRTKINYHIDVRKSVYIAPTAEALVDIKNYPGLIITATDDEYFGKKDIEEILTYKNHEVLIFENGNHSLESDDTLMTIDFCRKAVKKVIEFAEKE